MYLLLAYNRDKFIAGLQGYVNKIEFDYIEYARQRFQQYWLRKPALLGSSGVSRIASDKTIVSL